jgi:hypothetical protein
LFLLGSCDGWVDQLPSVGSDIVPFECGFGEFVDEIAGTENAAGRHAVSLAISNEFRLSGNNIVPKIFHFLLNGSPFAFQSGFLFIRQPAEGVDVIISKTNPM